MERASRETNDPRVAELRRATETAIGQLEERDISVTRDDDPDAIAELLEAVELFERVGAAYGSDSMINTLDSSQPERPNYVLPERTSGESVRVYAARVREAARMLQSGGGD
jgi:hypothetical protein